MKKAGRKKNMLTEKCVYCCVNRASRSTSTVDCRQFGSTMNPNRYRTASGDRRRRQRGRPVARCRPLHRLTCARDQRPDRRHHLQTGGPRHRRLHRLQRLERPGQPHGDVGFCGQIADWEEIQSRTKVRLFFMRCGHHDELCLTLLADLDYGSSWQHWDR